MSQPRPFISAPMQVVPEWIDYNGHMNMAYYNVLCDRCADEAYDLLGIGIDYVKTRNLSAFTAEFHVCYLRELQLGDRVTVTFRLLAHDAKRLRVFQEIIHEDGWVAATAEALAVHVDLSVRKSAPFPADVLANIAAMAEDHAALPMPERAGRAISLGRAKS